MIRAKIISALELDRYSDPLIETGDYTNGFWHNELCVDLEGLLEGEPYAFFIRRNVHSSAGRSFREYYGIDVHAKLPTGVDHEAVIELCTDIYKRRKELTKGLKIEYFNSNLQAIWYDKVEYWNNFADTLRDLPCREVYDLSDYKNYNYVVEAIKKDLPAVIADSAPAIEAWLILNDLYITDNDYIYIGHSDFCKRLAEENKENEDSTE